MVEDEGEAVNQTVSEHARMESLPKDAVDLPRWAPSHTGPYDLNDPYDNRFAFAKAQANLSGDYYWLGQHRIETGNELLLRNCWLYSSKYAGNQQTHSKPHNQLS